MKKILYILFAVATTTTACRHSEIQHDEERRNLQLNIERQAFDQPDSLEQTPQSKATETAFAPLDSIGVYVHTTPATTPVGNHTPNLLYSTTNGTSWTAGGHLSDLLQTGTTYTATGYYPYNRLLIDPTAFVFSVAGNQTTAAAVTQSDLMATAPTAIANPTATPTLSLTFKHLFTKVAIKFAVPPSIDGQAVTLVERVDLRSVVRAAKVNLADGTLSTPDNKGDISMCLVSGDPSVAGSEVVYEAIAPPQTVKKEALLVELSFATAAGTRLFSYRPAADEVWVSNLKRNLHLVSVGDLCFASYLDLTDGLAHTDLALQIKAPTGPWTVSSAGAWLTLSTAANGTYASSVSGTGTGAEQTIYVKVTANGTAAGISWMPRSALLTLVSGTLSTKYTVTQNFYRFGAGAATWVIEAGQSVRVVAPFVSNQEWKAAGSADWLRLSPSAQWGEGTPVQEYEGSGSVGANGLFVQFGANNTAAAREGTVTFTPATAEGTATTTTILQPVATCELEPRTVEVSKYASTATPLFTVTVPKGVRWKLVSTTPGGVGNMNLSVVPGVGTEQVGTGEPQQVVGSYLELATSQVRWADVVVAWAAYGADQQATVRVTQNLEAVLVNNVWWATGNLVATGARGSAGVGGCAIGSPTDGGLYFQFGSLIGWRGGALVGGGKGQGMPDAAWNNKYWGGAAAFSWANDSYLWPANMAGNPTAWPTHTYTNQWYFGYKEAPYATGGQDIREYAGYSTGGLSHLGIGDACSYYLGGTWRLPTLTEHQVLRNSGWSGVGFKSLGGVVGHYFGPFAAAAQNVNLFFPAAGYSQYTNGAYVNITLSGFYINSTIADASQCYDLDFLTGSANPQDPSNRTNGFSVRCVADFVDTKAWTAPMAGGSKLVKVFTPKGQVWTAAVVKGGSGLTLTSGSGAGSGSFTLTYPSAAAGSSRGAIVRVTSGSSTYELPVTQSEIAVTAGNALWAKGNLIATGAQGAAGKGGGAIGAPTDNGLYFQFGSLIGYKGGAPANGGNGVGRAAQANYKYWDGAAAFSWENDAYLWPTELGATHPTEWPDNDGEVAGDRTSFDYYFSYNAPPYSTPGQNIRGFNVPMAGDAGSGTLATGRYAKFGVGDPCTYYLGSPWRLPTIEEQLALMGGITGYPSWVPWATPGVTGRWVVAGQTFGGIAGTGAWFGAGLSAGAGTPDPAINPFFPSGGARSTAYHGIYINAVANSSDGLYQTHSVGGVSSGAFSYYHAWYGIVSQGLGIRKSEGVVVRCVMDL